MFDYEAPRRAVVPRHLQEEARAQGLVSYLGEDGMEAFPGQEETFGPGREFGWHWMWVAPGMLRSAYLEAEELPRVLAFYKAQGLEVTDGRVR